MTLPVNLYCDLHVHSCMSDGADTPKEAAAAAAKAGLRTVALTDHNTISGLAEFSAAAKNLGLNGICGCEFSTEYAGKELHILGLYLPEEIWPDVRAYTDERNKRKARSNRECTERLAAAGYDISYDAILEKNPGASINRMHIARELMEKGYAPGVKEALYSLLQPEQGYFLEPARMDAIETLRRIRAWGGVSVWAHPLTSADYNEAEAFLPALVDAGLDGIEVLYSLYSEEDTRFALSLAERFALLPSGGSDYHGINKPDISIGTGRGNLQVPNKFASALARRAESHRLERR